MCENEKFQDTVCVFTECTNIVWFIW